MSEWEQFLHDVFPIFEGKFDAFYIIGDLFIIVFILYLFFFFIELLRGMAKW